MQPSRPVEIYVSSRFRRRNVMEVNPAYSVALRDGERQHKIMQEVMASVAGIMEKWDTEEVEKAILARI